MNWRKGGLCLLLAAHLLGHATEQQAPGRNNKGTHAHRRCFKEFLSACLPLPHTGIKATSMHPSVSPPHPQDRERKSLCKPRSSSHKDLMLVYFLLTHMLHQLTDTHSETCWHYCNHHKLVVQWDLSWQWVYGLSFHNSRTWFIEWKLVYPVLWVWM